MLVRYPLAEPLREDGRIPRRLPELFLFFGRRSDFSAFDPLKKVTRQPALARMALAMDCAQVEKFIAKSIALVLLRENLLQGDSQLAEARRFRPRSRSCLVIDVI